MAVGQAVVPWEPLLRKMRGYPVITEGTRNNDCVNLAIIAYAEHPGIETTGALQDAIMETVDKYLLDGSEIDMEYLEHKCAVLLPYLPEWEKSGNIFGYGIV